MGGRGTIAQDYPAPSGGYAGVHARPDVRVSAVAVGVAAGRPPQAGVWLRAM
jgi:hypothetical protein